MKKKNLYGCAALFIGFAAVINVNSGLKYQSKNLSALALSNVEALASGEVSNINCDPFWQAETCTTVTIQTVPPSIIPISGREIKAD